MDKVLKIAEKNINIISLDAYRSLPYQKRKITKLSYFSLASYIKKRREVLTKKLCDQASELNWRLGEKNNMPTRLSYFTATQTLVFSNSDGMRMVFPAISGPHGKGRLPRGFYSVGVFTPLDLETCAKGFIVDDIAFWIPIDPQFQTNRTGLGIHPDGNVKGTLGCIGIDPLYVPPFVEFWKVLENKNELPQQLFVF